MVCQRTSRDASSVYPVHFRCKSPECGISRTRRAITVREGYMPLGEVFEDFCGRRGCGEDVELTIVPDESFDKWAQAAGHGSGWHSWDPFEVREWTRDRNEAEKLMRQAMARRKL